MKRLKCLVLDDERAGVEVLRRRINERKDLYLVASTTDTDKALSLLSEHPIDVLFLDIHLGQMSGLQFKELIDDRIQVIMCSADAGCGTDVFEIGAVEYLVKPIAKDRFAKAIENVKKRLRSERDGEEKVDGTSEWLTLKVPGGYQRIALVDIDYIESLNREVTIYTIDQAIPSHYNLAELLRKLPTDRFIQIHRSFIVSINQARGIKDNQLLLKDKNRPALPIGKWYRPGVMALFDSEA